MKVESLSIGGTNNQNEDRLAVQFVGKHGLAAVLADGMGGLSLGDLAAEVVTQSTIKYLAANYHGGKESELLRQALGYADGELRCASIDNRSNMGAAVAVAIVKEKQLYCTWQGNVRVYVLHNGKLNLLTTDHIANLGYGNTALTRCIKGAGLRNDVPVLTHKLNKGDIVLICTDGLYMVAENTIGRETLEEIKAKLLQPNDDASVIQITIE